MHISTLTAGSRVTGAVAEAGIAIACLSPLIMLLCFVVPLQFVPLIPQAFAVMMLFGLTIAVASTLLLALMIVAKSNMR